MPAYKDSRQGTWYASFYFENWQGVKQKKLKRGFATKKDALAWEREFLLQQAADLTMNFEAFVEIYITDKKKRLRENTWSVKEHIIRTKMLPYFKEKRLSEIRPRDVIAWQNEMLNYRDKNGKAYSPTYLKTLHGQLSAILNHAVRFYGLKSNAAATAGCMGSEKHKEMLFWTKEDYLKFAEAMMDKPQSYYAFEVLYWCGIREGELLALTPADFDLDKGLLSITKSYQRLKGRDVITDPKTPKSVRVIQMPQFLTDEIRDYLKCLYKVQPDQRIFEVTKSYLHHEMDRGAKRRTDNTALLDIVGRDQPDQELTLEFNRERCVWEFQGAETELWKLPPDPLLEAVAKMLSPEQPEWSGTPTELLERLPGVSIQANILTRKLNVSADRLYNDYGIRYESRRTHEGREVKLTLENSGA